MDFWQRYRAIDARDTRFDGQFYTAVRTTGIYCRPSCPARTPKADNVTFYETSAAAHDAGYRACKRCLPEAVPGTPAWNVRSDIAGRAMRLINDGVINRDGVEGLAARLGYSSRQLNRILSHELGAGPLSLARASRAQTARTLLVSTSMKARGHRLRRRVQQRPPVQRDHGRGLRHDALRAAGHGPAPPRPRGHHGAHAQPAVPRTVRSRASSTSSPSAPSPGSRQAPPTSYARTLRLPHGDARFRVEYDAGAPGRPLVLTIGAVDLRDLAALLSRVRRLLDLDADPVAIDGALGADPRLAAAVARTPGIRMPGAVDPQELLIRAMIGQQITVAAARTALAQLSAAGSASLVPDDGLHRLFPTAAQIAGTGFELLRGPAAADRLRPWRRGGDGLRGPRLRLRRRRARAGGETPAPGRRRAVDRGIRRDAGHRRAGCVPGQRRRGPQRHPFTRPETPDGADPDAPDFREVSPWRSYATMHLWRAAAAAQAAARKRPADEQAPNADSADRKRNHESPAADHVHPGRPVHHHCPRRRRPGVRLDRRSRRADRPDPPGPAARPSSRP